MKKRPKLPAVMRTITPYQVIRSLGAQMQFVTMTGEPLRISHPHQPACVLVSAQTWEAVRFALSIMGDVNDAEEQQAEA